MEPVICKCGATDNYRVEPAGPHLKAICNFCDQYIKFLPQPIDDDTLMYFGKYRGRRLKDIPLDYFRYMLEQGILSGSLKQYAATLVNEAR